jgi:hypothetical protein
MNKAVLTSHNSTAYASPVSRFLCYLCARNNLKIRMMNNNEIAGKACTEKKKSIVNSRNVMCNCAEIG